MAAPIKDRIIKAIKDHGDCGFLVYHRLAEKVFPKADYPNAWNSPTKGGHPCCYMVLSKAIREHGFSMNFDDAPAVCYTMIGLGKNARCIPYGSKQ
jgi:hypothetical protein